MKHIFDFFKPRNSVLLFSFFALTWQYFYSYAQYNEGYFRIIREYMDYSIDLVAWDNPIIRTASLGLIWILVAFVIFITLVVFENFSIYSYNRKIEAQYINHPKEDFVHLLRKREISLKRHLPAHFLLSASVMTYVFSVVIGTDIIENLRGNILQNFLINLQLNAKLADFNISIPLVISFIICFLGWYLIACFAAFLYQKSSDLHDLEKITEDHYAVVIQE